MKRFTVFSLILIAAVLLMGHVVLWVPQARAHSMTTTTYKIAENTSGPAKLNLELHDIHTYSIDSTDSDSQKFEISAVKKDRNQRWQELQFKSSNIPDYENPRGCQH